MVEESEDAAQETMSRVSRVAVTAASMAVQAIAKQREQRARELAEAEADRARELQSRWDAERASARAQLAATDNVWLDRATPQEVAGAWQTAAVWAEFEPDAFAGTEARLAGEIERRYGIDPRTAGTDGLEDAGDLHALADAERVREREHDEAARDAGARSEAAERDDELGAGIVMAGAAQDAAAELGSAAAHGHAASALDVDADGVEYDSDARRSALAERAGDGGAEPDAVRARVVAANANGKPGRQATSATSRAAAKSRSPQPAKARDIGLER